MRRIITLAVIVALCMSLAACYTNNHVIGKGAQGTNVQTARQWYALYGLVPINQVDTHAMAGVATDYEITTQITFLDYVISAFTGYVTVTCTTVQVKK